MPMSEVMISILSIVAGAVLGVIFFVGLWWTVRRAMTSRQPGLLVLGSMLGRTGLVMVGFYFVSGGQWQRLALCLAGFIVARIILVRVLPKSASGVAEVTHHAP